MLSHAVNQSVSQRQEEKACNTDSQRSEYPKKKKIIQSVSDGHNLSLLTEGRSSCSGNNGLCRFRRVFTLWETKGRLEGNSGIETDQSVSQCQSVKRSQIIRLLKECTAVVVVFMVF